MPSALAVVHCDPEILGGTPVFISPLFQATAQATEAAITNALLAAETTTGANDLRIYAMPVDRMLAAMKKYGRLP